VLTDENCGSSGESMLNLLRSMENVVVVGGNTGGAQLCGNVMTFYLPNSNLSFSFGVSLGFQFDTENVDYKGYEPDVWCDPQSALDAVLALLENSGLAGDTTALKQQLAAHTPADLTLRNDRGDIIEPGGLGIVPNTSEWTA
jgi:C-terminal processing protease CtpA/Prc